MYETSKLVDTLKAILKENSITYKMIALELDMSEANVKRMFSEKSFNLHRLEQICKILSINFYDLAKITYLSVSSLPTQLTIEQEELLVQRQDILSVFYLVIRKWQYGQIKDHLNLKDIELHKIMQDLETAKFIERLPKEKIRLLVSEKINWIPSGPLFKFFQDNILYEFLDNAFEGEQESISFIPCELSNEGVLQILEKLKQLEKDIKNIRDLDSKLPKKYIKSFGILLATRPWTYSVIKNQNTP